MSEIGYSGNSVDASAGPALGLQPVNSNPPSAPVKPKAPVASIGSGISTNSLYDATLGE